MIFGKYINRYYLRHAPALLLGILALLMVDYIQLLVPQLYRLVINGVNLGQVVVRGETMPFTKEVLFQHICLPMIYIIILMVLGRFLWRVCSMHSASALSSSVPLASKAESVSITSETAKSHAALRVKRLVSIAFLSFSRPLSERIPNAKASKTMPKSPANTKLMRPMSVAAST